LPFGSVALRDFGTYFIGYSRSPRMIEQMIEYLFFAPSATFLEAVPDNLGVTVEAARSPAP
jgi:putative iron-dependent peroxidase